jgi:AcrR family transcriptional regulator
MAIRVARKPSDAYQHGSLREALVQAGLKLLSEGGARALSLRAAAQLAGVSHAAPYRHFRDKDALVSAIAERGFLLLTEAMQAELARCRYEDAPRRLEAMGQGYIGFALTHPGFLRVIFGGVIDKKNPPQGLLIAGQRAYDVLRGVVARGLEAGELSGGDPDTVALACWSMVHGFSMLCIDQALPSFVDRKAQMKAGAEMVRLLALGVRTPATRPVTKR